MSVRLTPLSGLPPCCAKCSTVELPPGPAVVSGTYTMFETQCPSCQTPYLAHYPVGFAAEGGLALDLQSGEARTSGINPWYANNLTRAWRNRKTRPVRLTRTTLRPLRKPLLVDCIDLMFGHCLQHLFDIPNLQRKYPDRDIIVLVQDFVRWLVPDDVAEIWSVDIALREGEFWYDDLARQITDLLSDLPPAEIGGTIGEGTIEIEKFTRMAEFDLLALAALERPRLTIVWREDRCWTVGAGQLNGTAAVAEQIMFVAALAKSVRQAIPGIEIALAGIGRQGSFPDWIEDRRVAPGQAIDEMAWLRLYRASHVVLGVHGSNMLLPAAHAATVIELVPFGKWQQTCDGYDFIRRRDTLQALREVRFVPMSIPMRELVGIVQVMTRLARLNAYTTQWRHLADDEARRLFRSRYGHIYEYPDV